MKKRLLELERVRFAIQVLRDAGVRDVQIEDIMLGRHSEVCACWDCVLRLQNAAVMHRAKLVAKARWQRELSRARFACDDPNVAKGSPTMVHPGNSGTS